MRVKNWLWAGLGVTLAALSAYGQEAASKTLGYEKDVKPALESAVCVVSREFQGRQFFMPTKEGCTPAASLSPVQTKMSGAMAEVLANYLVHCSRLFGEAQKNVPEGPGRLEKLQKEYRRLLLSDETIVGAVMPKAWADMSGAGLACPDCPGPKQAPAPRQVALKDLMPYTLAFLWPARLMPDGGVSFMICVGVNGLSRMEHPDPVLAEAAFSCVNKNGDAMEMAEAALTEAMKPDAYKAFKGDEAKLDYLRASLAKSLPGNAAFVAEIKKQALEKLPAYGLACLDCAAAPEAAQKTP